MDVVVERATGLGVEEALGDGVTLVVAPLTHHVRRAAFRELADQPFDKRAAGRPRLGLERRDDLLGPGDALGDAGTGVGGIEGQPVGVGFRFLVAEPDQLVDRAVGEEGVLHDGADVVVDVDDCRELAPVGEAHAEEQVVAVAEDVHHLGGLVHVDFGQPCQPARELVATLAHLVAQAGPRQLVVEELGHHGEHRSRLPTVGADERLDHDLGVRVHEPPVGVREVRRFRRMQGSDHHAHQLEQVERMRRVQRIADGAEQLGLDDRRLVVAAGPRGGHRPIPVRCRI